MHPQIWHQEDVLRKGSFSFLTQRCSVLTLPIENPEHVHSNHSNREQELSVKINASRTNLAASIRISMLQRMDPVHVAELGQRCFRTLRAGHAEFHVSSDHSRMNWLRVGSTTAKPMASSNSTCSHAARVSVFASPGRYVQGAGATEELGRQLKHVGIQGRLLVIAGGTALRQLQEIWRRVLPPEGIDPVIEQFSGECSQAEIDRLSGLGQAERFAAVLAAGGGKAVDTARAVADDLGLPVVVTPTLASTDAPCSALSVIYTPDGSFERYRFYGRHPLLVLVDTAVIARSPKRQLVSGIGDALATWFEARTVREACAQNQIGGLPTTTGTALAKLCCEVLLADGPAAVSALEVGAVTPALERLVEANTLLSGLGFESGGLAVAHAVHNGFTELSSTHHCLHGEKVAMGLLTQLVLEGRPHGELKEILAFQKAIGLPISLAEVGVDHNKQDDIHRIASRSVAPGETSHHEPFEVTAAAVADALLAADALGRQWLS